VADCPSPIYMNHSAIHCLVFWGGISLFLCRILGRCIHSVHPLRHILGWYIPFMWLWGLPGRMDVHRPHPAYCCRRELEVGIRRSVSICPRFAWLRACLIDCMCMCRTQAHFCQRRRSWRIPGSSCVCRTRCCWEGACSSMQLWGRAGVVWRVSSLASWIMPASIQLHAMTPHDWCVG